MSTKYTPVVNQHNVQTIREQISKKKLSQPYLATSVPKTHVMTDYDSFPYTRWFRGVPQMHNPVIAEREAGWRTRRDDCYNLVIPVNNIHNNYPNHCFETACSTTFPCYPNYLKKFADKEAMDVMLNKTCTTLYR
jgi:hypothetical protein